MDSIEGVVLTPLKQIPGPKGRVFHALKQSESSYAGFGEAYFSEVYHGEVKGWKKHTRMVLNLIVPFGKIEFRMLDERSDSKTFGKTMTVELSPENYQRLTVPAGIWMAFKGIGIGQNILLNIASIEHDPTESVARELAEFPYEA
ncbi:MAG TPA: hypothetical protein VF412_11755 [Bdellovibrio sp.]|uniref:dTDP-4-dehydrorhamnose 3,5-epimerase family protein n=1 Tax=Bdellovibrio sp. TaxID=28201 RepID=UPI002F0560F7